MLINIVIIYLFHSTSALFHHHKALPHTRIHVCLTPPNTLLKVQKHIIECQHEVKSNIFNEAFSLINDHAFHHPDDHTSIHLSGHDDFAHRNFTLTEQEILTFFENHGHPSHGTHGTHGAAGQMTFGSGPLGSSIDLSHEHDSDEHEQPIHTDSDQPIHDNPIHDHPIHDLPAHDPIVHHPNPHPYGWQHPYPIESFYKKTDAVQLNNNPEEVQRLTRTPTAKNPYTYFNPKTGEPVKIGADRPRRSVHELEIHAETHTDEIHPTTASFKDKRIAGCLMHCLYEKNHAIDPHTGYPTLDGLVNFYSDGVHEHGFFMTTLRAVDFCLKGASHKYHINRHVKPSAGVSCDLAFDIFDCVSDQITSYCSKHHFHGDHFVKGHHLSSAPLHSHEHVIDPHYPSHHHGHIDDEYRYDDSYYYN
ncbi:uncharacterized protein LOC129577146 [Sitodiplosis mosellana]|uniref:uncharacterized protein LOC129577146 n=1 Tax=Sitodiplosis mosellana TaxID=263140 RepID=UPI0024446625|nr:uncharacterized protein LOC129577146 [Sitodiplosis mosellana]